MTNEASPRTSIFAASLFLLVAAILIAPIGAIVIEAIADAGGGSASTSVVPDTISDTVAATAAEFRVDESGAATYSIPLYGVPGTAGVAPKLSLSYSSQGGYGPLGKGWSIGEMSSIARCRATREAGDATAESNPAPINFSATDQYCLDGQRLLAVANSPACAAAGGMGVQQLRTEIESFQRVCAYTTTGGTNGPSFFTVERKDGSTSWYGDRDNNATANRADGYFETNSPLKPAAALLWAQTRFQDSTGNYIDFIYSENPAGATTREHLISEIRYTGKTVLSGQTGSAKVPYAKIAFNYGVRATAQQAKGYSAAGTLDQTRRLDSITSCASAAAGACATGSQARFYQLTYAAAPSGNGQDALTSLQECRDSGKTVCMAPTTFAWSVGTNEFATIEKPTNFSLTSDDIRGFKMADINGDGRLDMVLEYTAGSGCSGGTWIVNALSMLDASGLSTFGVAQYNCVPINIVSRGNGAWHLFDYNGDGRDDLFVSSATNQGWRIHPSNGTGFDMSTNLAPGVIPSVDDKDSQPQLADLNGDGLTDVVYPSGTQLRARLMERQSSGFMWGAERTVNIDASTLSSCKPLAPPPESRCSRTISTLPTTKTGFMQMADFNSDAASDLLIGVTETVQDWTGNCEIPIVADPPPETSSLRTAGDGINSTDVILPYVSQVQAERISKARALIGGVNCYTTSTYSYLYAFTVKSLTSGNVSLAAYDTPAGANPYAIVLADANGDGLTDAFVRASSSSEWAVRINTGAYFLGATLLPLSDYRDQAQFADVNGDGRTDMLYVVDSGGNKVYYVRYALPGGGFGTGTALTGGNARLCEGSGCNVATRSPIFADVDGDGNLDFLSLAPSLGLYVSRASTRFTPRDVITRITNGLGAQTDITYAPLTNKDLYRRDTGSRNNLNWGRGSPVMDFLAPTYAVARASSSSPQAGAPTAKATVHYRYAGARVQSGGRGFLGFAVIDTIDPNQTGGHVVTTTSYAQNFPFVGMPVQTVKKAVANLAYLLPACLNGTAITNACFATPGQPHTDLGGNWFSDSGQVWESAPAVLTAQVPLHVRTFGTDEKLRDPFTGTQTSEVMTSFGYGTYGNVASTSVQTYTGASTLVSTVATANTYTDDAAKWRLGRLTGSTVTHSRPGMTNVVRTSNFTYSTAGAYTGLLTVERSQYGGPVDQDLRKEYTYDDYGNKTIAKTCANPATACTTAISFHPASATAIQRYGKVTYDAIGRFPVSTIEPFWNGTGAVEKTVNTVVARNIFGDAIQAYDLNGVDTLAVAGTLGRPYYSWAETVPGSTPGATAGGGESWTTYRFCGTGSNQVNCPAGARFRQRVVAEGAPRQWTYFDVLGRPVLKSAETFNVNVIGKDVAATCTDYDATGKPSRVSNPFFLAGTGGTDGPTGLDAVCTSGARLWTSTSYDLLGRPVRVDTPDPNGTATAITAYSGLDTLMTDPRGNVTKQTRNGKGELTKVTDAAGLVMYYNYFADGSLGSVMRDAGRGVVSNYFAYDALGRKTQQDDPDSGLSQFQYNALGELIVQVDASGQRIENEYDARGRAWRRTTKTSAGVVESQSTFNFDTAAYGVGQLANEVVTGTYSAWIGQPALAHSYSRNATYDTFGRGSATTTTIDGVAYPGSVAYDTLGRPWKGQDASSRWIKTEYDARGAAAAVCDSSATDTVTTCPADASTYLRTLTTDEWGHVTKERRGSSAAMEVNRTYYTQNGRVAEICGGTSAGCNLIKEGYGWDAAGNLSTRSKESRYVETFLYDSLNRLQEARMVVQNGITTNQVLLAQVYDKLGNICQKTEAGETRGYTYIGKAGCGTGSLPGAGGSGVAGPHQLTALTGQTLPLYYDPQGNQTIQGSSNSADGSTFRYSTDNHAYELNIGPLDAPTKRLRFWYGPDGQRYKQDDAGKKTLYVGGVEIVVQGGSTTFRRYLGGVAVQTVSGAVVTTKYMFQDQLGSLVRLANADGTVAESLDYAPYGKPRSYTDPDVLINPLSTAFTPRGFTGHEHLPGTGIIHMNGRIYSPNRGRFLQPDPVIQSPENTQSWNAYTYVFNNPLTYTDPTGNFSLRQTLAVVIGIVAACFGQYYITHSMYLAAFGVAVAGGFAAGYVGTGTFKGGVQGAFGAAMTFGISAYGLGGIGNVIAQGFSGGIIESLRGGSFGNGFMTAGLTAAFMPQAGYGNVVARSVKGALIGGTISEVTGGKFANGAISGAIQGAMSGKPDSGAECADGCKGGIGKPVGARYQLDQANPDWRDNLSVVQEDGVTVVRGHLTVSGPGADYAARDVTAVWGNASGEYEGVMYRSEITMSAVKKGGDWTISRWNKSDWMRFNETLCSGIAGAKVNMIGGSGLIVPPINSVWQQPGTPAHEFGHGLGLSHAPPGSGSIMSYDAARTATGRDIYNLVGGYR